MISTFFINRPIFSAVISILFIIGGIMSLISLPVAQFPSITPPTISVSAEYPGASASTIAAMVANPIEDEVNNVEGMLYMQSTSSSAGTYNLVVTFDLGVDIDMATVLVQNKVSSVLSSLPQEVVDLGVVTTKESTNILMLIALSSKNPMYNSLYLSNYANINLVNNFARIHGVGNVQLFGAGVYSMRIWLNPEIMTIRGISPEKVISAIKAQNIQVASGAVGAPPYGKNNVAYQYTIQTEGLLLTAEEFGNIIIKSLPNGEYLRVKDVAQIDMGSETYNTSTLMKGEDVAVMALYQLPGSNALEVSSAVQAEMKKMAQYLPDDIQFEVTLDTTEFIDASIKDIYTTLFTAFILVLIVVLVFLQNWRATLIPLVAVPVSLIGTFMVMSIFGFTINTLSLFGMVLAIGLVVDDAIIIVENTYRLIETGKFKTIKEAVIQAMNEVSSAIISIVLVLMAVFLPAGFVSGITGELYRQFALTIAFAVIISGFNALTLSPALCALLLKPKKPAKFFFYVWFNDAFAKVVEAFTWLVRKLVTRPVIAIFVFIVLTLLAFWGYQQRPKSFIPTEDEGYFFVMMQLADGTALEETEVAMNQASEILSKMDGIRTYVAVSGFSLFEQANQPNVGTLFVMLENWDKRKTKALSSKALVDQFNEKAFMEIRQAITFAVAPSPIPGLGSSNGVEIMIEDINSYGSLALQEAVMKIIAAGKQTKVFSELNTEFSAMVPQYYLDIDRDKAEFFQVNLSNVFSTLSAYWGTNYINNFVRYGKTLQVRLSGDINSRLRIGNLTLLNVPNSKGEMVPLSAFTRVKTILGPDIVTRYNTYPAAMISATGAPGESSNDAIVAMENSVDKAVGKSFGYEWTSVALEEVKSGSSVSLFLLMAVIIAYFIMCAKYESFTSPVAVIMGLPIALLGVVIATMIVKTSISIYTQIGIILLIGLAAKNAILIVEFARDYHARGQTIDEAAIEGGRIRLRPIVMTSFAFIFGTLPLVIAKGAGAASERSLGIAVFGGMIMTVIVGTLFIPNFYKIMQQLQEKIIKPKKQKETEEEKKEPL